MELLHRPACPAGVVHKVAGGLVNTFLAEGIAIKRFREASLSQTVSAGWHIFLALALVVALGLAGGVGRGGAPVSRDSRFLATLTARPIGPAAMSGRIVDVAVAENKPALMYVASASGGLWKTINNGTTWKPVFEREATVSLGAVAVAPSDPEIVWVGTGEANPRNSVSWGDGVYRSNNGGRTWTHAGLRDTGHIGRIIIHPKNPRIVYVAALGRLWGPNRERGLFKTTDAGRTWRQVKFINEDTGFIDLAMDPKNPNILYAAAYQVRRGPFAGGNPAVQTGPGSGLFKSIDGGETWLPLKHGLPRRPLGRCGLAVSRRDPRILYAVVQTDLTSTTVAGQAAKTSSDADLGGVFRSPDRGETWTKLNDLCPRPFYYGQIRVDPLDDRRVYVLGLALHVSVDGSRTFQNTGAPGIHADHHALWIDPRDTDHLVLGGDGGLHFSYDRGRTWEHLTNLPVSQLYTVAVDLRKPYRIFGGLQDSGTWCGPSATHSPEGIRNADWFRVLDADGFHCQVDPGQPDRVFAESQWGALYRIDLHTGARTVIRPQPPHPRPLSPEGRGVGGEGEPEYRFNWSSPLLLSAHPPRTLYFGGNYLFRSRSDGDHWKIISPDLTRGRPGASADFGHTLTTIAESPLKAGLLYAGTDDGRLWVSRDGGTTWLDRSDRFPKLPALGWISRVECSHFAEGTAYATIDRHRDNDRAPYIFQTVDYGATWQTLTSDLPAEGPVYVIRESARNPNLLFAGTEFGLFATLDSGGHWHRLRVLPTVAVHDLVIHPRERDLAIATHGRGIYVMDLAPLEDLTPKVLATDVYLFEPKPAVVFHYRGMRVPRGAKSFVAPNPPAEAVLHYYLREALETPILVTIQDTLGRTVVNLNGGKEAGLHRVVWKLRQPANAEGEPEEPAVAAGEYTVKLKAGKQVLTRMLRVREAHG